MISGVSLNSCGLRNSNLIYIIMLELCGSSELCGGEVVEECSGHRLGTVSPRYSLFRGQWVWQHLRCGRSVQGRFGEPEEGGWCYHWGLGLAEEAQCLWKPP